MRPNATRLLILLAALGVTACNTVSGIGRDVQSVGRTVQDAAD